MFAQCQLYSRPSRLLCHFLKDEEGLGASLHEWEARGVSSLCPLALLGGAMCLPGAWTGKLTL